MLKIIKELEKEVPNDKNSESLYFTEPFIDPVSKSKEEKVIFIKIILIFYEFLRNSI